MGPMTSIIQIRGALVKLNILLISLLLLAACGGSGNYWVEYVDQPESKKSWIEVTVGDAAVLAWDKSKIQDLEKKLKE